jgi:ABC-type oligopeptide transport system ATPase subunit
LTYLFISHNISVIRHISDRVAVMYLARSLSWLKSALCSKSRPPLYQALPAAVLSLDPRQATRRGDTGG